jgi:hypothetical protein
MKKTPLKKKSKKRSAEETEYSKLRLSYLQENHFCKAGLPNCSLVATDIHHMNSRTNEKLNDISDWIGVCRSCHTFIHNNPQTARDLNLLK